MSEDFHFHFNESSVEEIIYLDSILEIELVKLQKRVNYYTNNPLDILVLDANSSRLDNSAKFFNPLNEGQVMLDRGQVKLDLNKSLSSIESDFRLQVIKILVDEMMFGGSFQDRIKSANVINLPDWVLPGLYHYIAFEWDVETDNEMRYIQDEFGLTRFNNIPSEHDIIKGASFWKYLEFTYGEFAVPNLLYMARRSPKFNAAIYFAFQVNIVDVYRGWAKYFRLAYESDQNRTNPVNGLELNNNRLVDLHLFATNQLITLEQTPFGYSLFRSDLSNKNKTKLYSLSKDEHCLRPFSNSITSVGDTIVLITSRIEKTKFTFICKDKTIHRYKDLPVTGIEGFDNKLYYSISRYDSSTISDFYRDVLLAVPGYINSFDLSENDIALISEFDNNSDVYKYNITLDSLSKVYISQAKLRQVLFGSKDHLLFNSNRSGIWNGQLLAFNDPEPKSVTNYRSNILYHQYSDSIFLEYLDQSANSRLYRSEPLSIEDFYIYDTIYPTLFYQSVNKKEGIEASPGVAYIDTAIGYNFQSPVNSNYDFVLDNYDSLQSTGEDFLLTEYTIENNLRTFSPTTAYLSLTNEPLVTNTTGYLDNIPLLTPNRINLSLGGSLTDTYKKNYLKLGILGLIQAGARDIELQYTRLGKSTLDFRYLNRRRILFRQDYRDGFRTNLIQASLKHAAGKNIYLENGLSVRNERYDPFILNEESFQKEAERKWIVSWKSSAKYKYQSTRSSIDIETNLEPMFEVQSQTYNVTTSAVARIKTSITDKIYYTARLQAGSSQGSSPIYYMLGGVSNDVLSEFEFRPFSDSWQPILFQNVFGVRGFNINYRNGNSFITHSSQFGLKPLDYFFARPIASEVFSNLIFHTFFDIGTTFYGTSVYDSPNVLNTTIIESSNGGIRIERRAFKNPLIFSTGFGLSTKVYGYNLSLDYAFGYEDQSFQEPMWHFGLGRPI